MVDAAHFGRPHTGNRPGPNAEMERMIRKNWRVTIDEVAGELNIISHVWANHVIHDVQWQ